MSSPKIKIAQSVKIDINSTENLVDGAVTPATDFNFHEVEKLVRISNNRTSSRTNGAFQKKLEEKKGKFTEAEFDFLITKLKPKFIKILIKSGKLDATHRTKNGNIPLYYAIIYKDSKSVLKFLKENSSILNVNNNNITPLDRISINNLKSHFNNYCIKKDNYARDDIDDVNYKMCFDFGFFERENWIQILTKISDSSHLKNLLVHPFVQVYIEIKWHIFKKYFFLMLLFQTFIYGILAYFFYNGPEKHIYWCAFFVLLNLILKVYALFTKFEMIKLTKKISVPEFVTFRTAPAHSFAELFIVLASIVIVIQAYFEFKNSQNELAAFTFQAMSISILMTAAYHPKLSIWGIMLRKVTTKIIIFMLFFSLLLFSFTLGNGLLFSNDELMNVFVNTTTMLITSSQIEYNKETCGVFGKLYYLVYSLFIGIILINFLIGVAITDIERIKQKSEINSAINIIGYFCFANRKFLPQNLVKKIDLRRIFIQNENNDDKIGKVDFYVNRKEMQFGSDKRHLPNYISKSLQNKIIDILNNDTEKV